MASPASLLFRAVKGILASVPGGRGPYIGRRTDYEAHAAKETDIEKLNPVTTEENCEFAKVDAPTASALRRMARDGDIAPANSVTADYCGLPPATPPPAPPAPVAETPPPPLTSTFQPTTATRSDRAPRT